MRPLPPLARVLALTAVGFGAGCSNAPKPDTAPGQPAPVKSGEPLRLELVKVEADTLRARFGGEPTPISSTWAVTVKPVPQADSPPAASDLWLWCVFITGRPDEAKVAAFLGAHPPGKLPRAGTMSLTQGSPGRKVEYRFGQKEFTPKELEEAFGAGAHGRFGYAMLLAPKAPEEKWDGRAAREITFTVRNGYDNLNEILLKKAKPLEHDATAVVRLCTFDKPDGADATFLSAPLRISLEPGAEGRPR